VSRRTYEGLEDGLGMNCSYAGQTFESDIDRSALQATNDETLKKLMNR
jgi:hypothetical protein